MEASFTTLVAAWLLALPAAASADGTVQTATTGPGDAITPSNPDGTAVTELEPGTYTIKVMGPGVDEHAQVFPLADYTWTVTFGPGRYSFFSERKVSLHGSFTVGNAPMSNARLLHAVAGPDFSIVSWMRTGSR